VNVDSGGLEIRSYRPSDRAAVWELHNLALNEVGAHGGNGPWDDDLHEIERVYLGAGGAFVVGLLDAELVAMGALLPTGPARAEVKRMRVHPRVQGRGYGAAILAQLERAARELGFEELHLETTTGQLAAQALYRSRGYSETGRGRHGEFELILFQKRLHA
jgi:ribosomal protein S18 acetylase RimI-like enzyme